MKIWKGPEKEGQFQGLMTMFVKAESLDAKSVIPFLKQHPDCKRLYLGAGRRDLKKVVNSYELYEYCSTFEITIILEVSWEQYCETPIEILDLADQKIIRICSPKLHRLRSGDMVKIDNRYASVSTIEVGSMTKTWLADFKDDTFSCDEIIYEEKEN